MSNNSLSIEFRVSDIRQIMADNDTSILFVCFIRTVWGRFFVVVFFINVLFLRVRSVGKIKSSVYFGRGNFWYFGVLKDLFVWVNYCTM